MILIVRKRFSDETFRKYEGDVILQFALQFVDLKDFLKNEKQ